MVRYLKEHQRDFMPEDTKAGMIQAYLDRYTGGMVCSKQLKIPAAVNRHSFCPDLCKIGSGSGFVLQNVNLGLLRVHHDRDKSAVAGTVKGEKVKGVGSTAEHALTGTVCRVGFIGYLINLFLSA